jgi:hypothetical protein
MGLRPGRTREPSQNPFANKTTALIRRFRILIRYWKQKDPNRSITSAASGSSPLPYFWNIIAQSPKLASWKNPENLRQLGLT